MMKNQTKTKYEHELKIIPLGGCEEVGRNMTIFEYKNDIIILDMGIQFPEEDMPGINYVIPNISYLKGKENRIRAVVFTHAHLDHIGAAPILLEKLGNPKIIARPLTIEMIKHRQEDYLKGSSKKLKSVYVKSLNDKMDIGTFKLEFFQVDHAIMDAMGVVIKTPSVTVIHPGDWMIEDDPVGRQKIKYSNLAKLPKPTILMLESLGSIKSERPVTEKQMINNLKKLIDNARGRIIITTFSSQIPRIRQILEYATKQNKKVVLDGFSMKMNIEIAKKLGYIKIEKETMIPIDKVDNYPDSKIIMLITGAQGEEKAALSRIINEDHRFIKIKRTDTIVLSSSVIPGNERSIQKLKDKLYRLSDNVIHNDIMDIHTSGHGNIEDIKSIIRQIKPTYFIPVYANHFFLKEAAKIAYRMGFDKKNVIVPDNGSVITAVRNNVKMLKNKVTTDYVFVDGSGIGDIGSVVLKDRQKLADDGMFVIVAVVDKRTGQVKGSPDIISRGFIYLRESKDLLNQTRKKTTNIINKTTEKNRAVNWDNLKKEIKEKIGQFLFSRTERKPIILPVIIKV